MKRPLKITRNRSLPRFNDLNVDCYFAAQMENTPGWYVIGHSTAFNVTYLTVFDGENAKERAEDYRDWLNNCLKM